MKKYAMLLFASSLSIAMQAQIHMPGKISKDAVNVILGKKETYFRVIVKGFTCNRETTDDMLERDGKRDEIYISAKTYFFNSQGGTDDRVVNKVRSRVMGDVNNRAKEERRVMAGTAAGNLGGIQTGDQVPDAEPWKNNAQAKGDLLPFIIWEGELKPDKQTLTIEPSIFEYDGPDDFLTNFWDNSLIGTLLKPAIGLAVAPFSLLSGYSINNDNVGNRPVYDDSQPGIWPAPTVIQQFPYQFSRVNVDALTPQQKTEYQQKFRVVANKPNDRPIGVIAGSLYSPLLIDLNQTSALKLSNTDFGYGNGIIPITYKDIDELKGDYTIYLQIELLNDYTQKNQINITSNENFSPVQNFVLRNTLANDKMIDIKDGSMADGAFTVLYQPKKIVSQQWRFKKVENDFYYITSVYSNKCLGPLNLANLNGANIVTYPVANLEFYHWRFIRYCDGSFIFKNRRTNKVIEVYNAALADYSPLGQMENNAAANQRWFIEK
jgi:Ricin-type beta-trefoil lectin domain-like